MTKFSARTLDILKNFSEINPNLVFLPGKTQKTIMEDQGVMAIAELAEDIPARACVVDLNMLLSNIIYQKDPTLSFDEKWITITTETLKDRLKFPYGSEAVVKSPPNKTLDTSTAQDRFTLGKDYVDRIGKFVDINQLPMVRVGCDGTENYIEAYDPDNAEAPQARLTMGKVDAVAEVWAVPFKADRFRKLLSSDYTVKIIPASFAIFETKDITYYVASSK